MSPNLKPIQYFFTWSDGRFMVIRGAALLLPRVFQMVTQIDACVNINTINGTKKFEIENHVTYA